MSHRALRVRRAAAVAVLLALPAVVHGCSAPTSPAAVAGGGGRLMLDYDAFAASVEPVLQARGCDAGGDCHGAGIRGTFELSPQDAKNLRFDFDQVALQVRAAERDSSPILTEPLALTAGGTPHPYKPFAATSDSGWQALRAWVMSGVVQ